jgi:hypothetical protein
MMTKRANPFIYGGPVSPEKFIGRSSTVERVLDLLSSQARGSVAIIGERRIGKTSLLHYVSAPDVVSRWNLDDDNSIFIFQDCGSIAPFTIATFWKTILRRLLRLLQDDYPDSPLPGKVQALLAKPEITTLDIEFLLDEIDQQGLILVLMLDEFEWLVRTDPENEATTRNLLGGLRALINHVPRTLSLIVATRRPLDEVCRDVRFMGSPFYNNFVFVHLRPFSQEEAESLFGQMLAGTGVTFSQTEKDHIYSLAGTHPLLLQTAAALVFNAKLGRTRAVKDFAAIRAQFSDLVEHQFKDFWKWSLDREREILVQLACCHEEALTQLEAWAAERENLLRRGLIALEGGSYSVFSSVFWQWLIENLYRLEEINPPPRPELRHLQVQLEAHQRRLEILEEKEARHGRLHAPADLLIDIKDTRDKIRALEAKIAEARA